MDHLLRLHDTQLRQHAAQLSQKKSQKDTSGDTCIRIPENLGVEFGVWAAGWFASSATSVRWSDRQLGRLTCTSPRPRPRRSTCEGAQHSGFRQHTESQLMSFRSDHIQRLFLVWIPVTFAILLNMSSRASRPLRAFSAFERLTLELVRCCLYLHGIRSHTAP